MVTVDELVTRLTQAAERAIRAEAGTLAYDQHRIRGVTVDFTVTARGRVEPARVYVERTALRADGA